MCDLCIRIGAELDVVNIWGLAQTYKSVLLQTAGYLVKLKKKNAGLHIKYVMLCTVGIKKVYTPC